MKLVIGGAYQGKLSWAVPHYGLEGAELCDCTKTEPTEGAACYYHIEALTKRCEQPERYLPLFRHAVIVSREIGCGLVPMDAQERAWRERHGLFLRLLAAESDEATRVFCGLPEVLK